MNIEWHSIPSKLLHSEGVLLVLIPFFGSLVAFTFEAGYISYFGVPIELIQLDFVKIIVASVVVIFYACLYGIFAAITIGIVRGGSLFFQAMAAPAAAALLFVPLLALGPADPNKWYTLGMLLIGLAAIQLVSPAFQFRTGLTYIQRLKKQVGEEKAQAKAEKSTFMEKLIVQPIAFGFFLFVTVFLIGQRQAETQENYWVLVEDPSWVLIRNYGENFIFRKDGSKDKEKIGQEIRILKINESAPLTMHRAGLL